jgi:hypothetical protein
VRGKRDAALPQDFGYFFGGDRGHRRIADWDSGQQTGQRSREESIPSHRPVTYSKGEKRGRDGTAIAPFTFSPFRLSRLVGFTSGTYSFDTPA